MTSVLMTLLKLDFFFVFSFAAQLIPSRSLGYGNTVTETVLVFVLGAVGLSLAILAVYQENKYAMSTAILAGLLATAYFIYRLVIIALPPSSSYDPYAHTRQFLIFTTVVALFLILLTIAVAFKCLLNVHNGVFIFKMKAENKNKVYGDETVAIDHESVEDFEVHNQPTNASKTLLPMDSSDSQTKIQTTKNENMWSIE